MEKARAWVIEAKDKLAMRELDILEPVSYTHLTSSRNFMISMIIPNISTQPPIHKRGNSILCRTLFPLFLSS